MDRLPTSTKALPGRLPRSPELDALRGFFLVWMTLTHLPTRLSDMVNQPLGFASSAEGFIFLSALLVARLSFHKAQEDSKAIHKKLWKRSLRVYGYHLILLALAFTAAAAFAVTTHRAALSNLLDFYLAHPAAAIASSLLLIYCPPLLDILPMYVIFLALSPTVLTIAIRKGWTRVLLASGLIWLLAQFGLRTWVHGWMVRATGFNIPLQEMGAFNLFAWQALWILAMWIGAKSAEDANPLGRIPGWVVALSGPVCLFFLGVRHAWLGGHLTPEVLGMSLDKWQLGPLRVLNLFAFTCVVFWLRRYFSRLLVVEPLLTLGKASLEVFCAHLFFVFVGLALLYGEVSQLHGINAAVLVTSTFAGLILVALREGRKKRTRLDLKHADAA